MDDSDDSFISGASSNLDYNPSRSESENNSDANIPSE